jgi:hypothetical protein
MVRGRCNCGKKATSEWMVYHQPKKRKEKYGSCNTLIFCDECKPKQETSNFFWIYGKK